MKSISFPLMMLVLPCMFFCSPTQHAGGETTNGNGITVAVMENRAACRLNHLYNNKQGDCITISLFNADHIPVLAESPVRKSVASNDTIVFDSLPADEYTVLARNKCDTTAAFIEGIVISENTSSSVLNDTLFRTVSVSGIVASGNANDTTFVSVKGTDIVTGCSETGVFSLAGVPAGPCTIIAVSRSKLVGAPRTFASDTLAVDYKEGTVITDVILNPH